MWWGGCGRANAEPPAKPRTKPSMSSPRSAASTSPSWPSSSQRMWCRCTSSNSNRHRPMHQHCSRSSAPTLDEGPHLSYTIQWFIFSICVIVGWVLAVRRSMAMRSGKVVKKRRSAYIPIADERSES